jgi:hypothetical protein
MNVRGIRIAALLFAVGAHGEIYLVFGCVVATLFIALVPAFLSYATARIAVAGALAVSAMANVSQHITMRVISQPMARRRSRPRSV